MKTLNLSVGRKVFSLQCDESDAPLMQKLAQELNIAVNKNAIRYRGLSADNLLLVTALEMVAQNNRLTQLTGANSSGVAASQAPDSLSSSDNEINTGQPSLFDDGNNFMPDSESISIAELCRLEDLASEALAKIATIEAVLDISEQ